MILRSRWLVVLALLILTLPSFAQDEADGNLTACVESYEAGVDYFPDEVTFTHAEGVSVEYFDHYKVVTVSNAFFDAPAFTYVLIQCGTPAPIAATFDENTQFIEVPVESVVALSTTQLPHLVDLGVLDSLVAVDTGAYIYHEDVRALVAEGTVAEVGSGAEVNVESVLDLTPDVVFAYGYNPDTDAHPVLIDAGIFTALNGEYREASPLARAEWLKFTALFFNREAEANTLYDTIESEYQALVDLVAEVPADERPRVLMNAFSPYTEAWTIPGSDTYAGIFLRDAGANVILQDEANAQSLDNSGLFDFEVVYDVAADADVWFLNAYGVFTRDDLLAQDERNADFAPAQTGEVYNNIGRINENGGSDYYESGVTNPQIILADFIAILYPDLLPEHELVFWKKVE